MLHMGTPSPQNPDDLSNILPQSKSFFDLPEAIKNLAPHPPGGSHHRGFSGLGVEKISQNVFDAETIELLRNVPDVKESFESGNVNDSTQPNIWPPEDKLPGFREYTSRIRLPLHIH
jgi:isopenicillin N synthase-like dioxygenase